MILRETLKTPVQQGRGKLLRERKAEIIRIRESLIREAISWPKGTRESPRRIILRALPDGSQVYFEKPGKEADPKRSTVNPHDMRPVVGDSEVRLDFGAIWLSLARIPLVTSFEDFRAVLVLIYRCGHFLDHRITHEGLLRYCPEDDVDLSISELETRLLRAMLISSWSWPSRPSITTWISNSGWRRSSSAPWTWSWQTP